MVIDKIAAFTNIQSAHTNQIRKESGTDAAEKRSDRVEIDPGAGRLAQLREAVVKATKDAQEVRQDKVSEARAKIANGTLINDKVIDEIASRIVDSMGL